MRGSGILFPIFSLPGEYGIGTFSEEAYAFVDFLARAKQKYWQILPLGPTGYGDSPYQPFSTFAGNPYFIDLKKLIKEELLTEEECDSCDFGSDPLQIDYEKMYRNRFKLLKKAFQRSAIEENEGFRAFTEKNQDWLTDYAFFMAYKQTVCEDSFLLWPEQIRKRNKKTLAEKSEELSEEISFQKFLQYVFYEQWMALKRYANERGIQIIGDLPIYVATDSSDFWTHPEIFQVDENGTPTRVGGCPPDAFSIDGQLWGSPLYNWDYLRNTNYNWWLRRIEKAHELYDVIRIDHFRGFDSYYSIPADADTARIGQWEQGPGMNLFRAIRKNLGAIPIIAEDLGILTDSVRALVDTSGYPGMKVLQFAFDDSSEGKSSPYMPCFYNKNAIVYTGTHDNDTTPGFIREAGPAKRNNISRYLGKENLSEEETVRELIRIAMSSVADTVIIPLQDYLLCGSEMRTNTPGTCGKNWGVRFSTDYLTRETEDFILKLTETYYR